MNTCPRRLTPATLDAKENVHFISLARDSGREARGADVIEVGIVADFFFGVRPIGEE
jgi:hypothetical protein